MRLSASTPKSDATYDALVVVGEALDEDVCWFFQGRYHFPIRDGWTIAVRAESAGRFRVEACRWTRPVATMWALAQDTARLAGIAVALAQGVLEGV